MHICLTDAVRFGKNNSVNYKWWQTQTNANYSAKLFGPGTSAVSGLCLRWRLSTSGPRLFDSDTLQKDQTNTKCHFRALDSLRSSHLLSPRIMKKTIGGGLREGGTSEGSRCVSDVRGNQSTNGGGGAAAGWRSAELEAPCPMEAVAHVACSKLLLLQRLAPKKKKKKRQIIH